MIQYFCGPSSGREYIFKTSRYVSEHLAFVSAQILSKFQIYTCIHACVLNKYLKLMMAIRRNKTSSINY
jgi:hypothetical protein